MLMPEASAAKNIHRHGVGSGQYSDMSREIAFKQTRQQYIAHRNGQTYPECSQEKRRQRRGRTYSNRHRKYNEADEQVYSIPIRRAILGASGERKAKASSGKVVSMPVNVLDKPVLERIIPTKGPKPVMAARRFAAISIIPMISIIFPVRDRVSLGSTLLLIIEAYIRFLCCFVGIIY